MTTTGQSRAFASNCSISFGPFTLLGDLRNCEASNNDVELTSLCPQCGPETPAKVKQVYVCSAHDAHGPYGLDELGKGVSQGKGPDGSEVFRWVGKAAEVKAVRTPSEEEHPKNRLVIQAVLADSIAGHVVPQGKSYVFVPKGSTAFYGVLRSLLDGEDMTGDKGQKLRLIGEIRLRDDVKLVALLERDGNLVLQELVRPEDVKVNPPIAVEAEAKHVELLRQALSAEARPFDPEGWKDPTRQALKAFVGDVAEPAAAEIDLFAAMEASLKQVKARSTRRRKAS